MKLRVWVAMNLVGCQKETVVELDDGDYTEEQIEEIAREEMFEFIEWGYEMIGEDTTT